MSTDTATPSASSSASRLAIDGGKPVRETAWPVWPRGDASTEKALLDVLHSGRWTISGVFRNKPSYERQFSKAFAEFNGVPYCVPTTSGTASLTIAMLGLGLGAGDEVLTPGLTWVACASSIFCIGATPILVDIDPGTLAMSLEAARRAITPRTKAIILVHPFCRVGDIDGFLALAKEHNLHLIEDCSQAHGAKWRGQRVGTFGVVGCFSMQQTKVLTSGEGGAAITRDQGLYERMEQLRCDGRLFTTTQREGRPELREVGTVLGQNLCLSEFQAAVLCDRLGHLDAENQLRRDRAALLSSILREKLPGVSLLTEQPDATQTFYNLVLRFDPAEFGGNSADAIARAMMEELGVLIFPIYQPMNRHPLYQPLLSSRAPHDEEHRREMDPKRFNLPNADAMRARCIAMQHPVLLDEPQGMHDIVNALLKIKANAAELLKFPQS